VIWLNVSKHCLEAAIVQSSWLPNGSAIAIIVSNIEIQEYRCRLLALLFFENSLRVIPYLLSMNDIIDMLGLNKKEYFDHNVSNQNIIV
jgi:hypothetical protein